MDEGTAAQSATGTPGVRFWPAQDLQGLEFDPVLAELMREGPITRIRLPYGEGWAWLATRFEDVVAITNDSRFVRAPVTERQVTRLAPHFKPRPGSLAFADPPEHHRLRRAVAPAFTAPAADQLRPRAQQMLDELVDALLDDGPPADLTAQVLEPFPIAIHCEVMGVPEDDRARVHRWTKQIVFPSRDAQDTERAKNGLYGWLAEAIRSRRGRSGQDVLTLLGAAVADGELAEGEAIGLAGPLQIGGEAVTNNVGQMLYLLLTRPHLMERLRTRPDVRPQAIDELLRYIPHRNAVGLARIAQKDVEIQGTRISAGDPVYVSYLAANRDPEPFPDPDRVDFDRSPNPHLSFGHGPHYCTGALLARLQIDLLIDTLLERLPALRLAVPAEEIHWRRNALIRGPEALPVAW